ncbi:MAG: phosphatidylinositol-specific phospholipase C1-like protein [Thermodesulfobacteriota bacterium]
MHPRRLDRALPVLAVALALSACGDASSPSGAYPRDDELRLNHMQVLGSHNSYHIEPQPALFSLLSAFLGPAAEGFEYTHLPLAEQFSTQGIRQIELDVFADPEGGLYAERAGQRVATGDGASNVPALDEPGFKVLHVQDVDFETTCFTFVECLEQVRAWSDGNPGHAPLFILVEAKDDTIPDPGLGFVIPLPIGASEFDVLDAEIRSVFPSDRLITPDDVRGEHETLEAAILAGGWPTLGAARGKVFFGLDNGGAKKDAYVAGHPSLRGRVLFTSSLPGEPEAAFVKLNDPIADGELIRDLVSRGFIVRTRADADTVQARTGDNTQRDAALASGAQFVSTDYPVPDPDFGTGYRVEIPGGTPARCNPVSAPPGCTSLDIESPAALAG